MSNARDGESFIVSGNLKAFILRISPPLLWNHVMKFGKMPEKKTGNE